MCQNTQLLQVFKFSMTKVLPFTVNRTMRRGGIQWAAALSIVLVAWPGSSDALSLGRTRGAAVLGRSLDVSVLATLEPQESAPEASCFSAEVLYGDNKISNSSVSVTPLRTSPSELTLRVRSSVLIDEAFVTINLRSTCGSNVAKRFVLLSDSPTESSSAAQLPNLALLGAPTSAANTRPLPSATNNGNSSTARAERAQQRDAARASRKQQTSDGVESTATAKPNRQAKAERVEAPRSAMSPALGTATPKNTSRLKVDLMDLVPGREPSLRASNELLSQPTTDMQARAQAAAMWRAINASPEDLLRDAERLKTIETDVLAMSQLTKQQTQELTVLKTDLAQAKRSRYANPLVYALGALSLGSLAFGIWAWRRSRQNEHTGSPWWGSVQSYDDSRNSKIKTSPSRLNSQEGGSSIAVGKLQSSQDRERAFVEASKLVTPEAGSKDVGAKLAMPPPSVRILKTSELGSPSRHPTSELVGGVPSRGWAKSGHESDFGASVLGGLRPVNAEELFDIQQQADFFMSLGQHAQAIDILQNHISDNLETSALAYLDLFDIYHTVGKRDEFVALRDEFNRVFNAQVPEYDQYGLTSRGLEDYHIAMERIQSLWPNPKVLEVIEESIFRKPDHENEPFDLLAYRELMLLYAVAKDVSENDSVLAELQVDFDTSLPPQLSDQELGDIESAWGADKTPSNFTGTQMQPLSTATSATASSNTPPSADLGGGVKDIKPSDWDNTVKKLAKTSKTDNVDIDFELNTAASPLGKGSEGIPIGEQTVALKPLASAQPNSVPSVTKKAGTENAGNGINFELIPKRNFSKSKQGKL
jgi:hypothetical protein